MKHLWHILILVGFVSTLMNCYVDIKFPLKEPSNCDVMPNDPACRKQSPDTPTQTVVCGDGRCTPPIESCSTCPRDCPCEAGQICIGDVCTAASRCGDGRCDPQANETCTTCPVDCACGAGTTCQQSICRPCLCTPQQKRCQTDMLEQCAPDCLSWQPLELCPAEKGLLCDPKTLACKCQEPCTPLGASRCKSEAEAETCIQIGQCILWYSQICTKDQTCRDGRCCECKPKEKRCNGDTYDQKCGSDCQWEPKRSCKKDHILGVCLTGDCY